MRKRQKPRLSYKKVIKKRKKACDNIRELMKKFSSDDWMYFIASMDNNEHDIKLDTYMKAEMFTLVMDLALRLSKDNKTAAYTKPTYQNYRNVISYYFECDDTPNKLIKELGIVALPFAMAWQNKLMYPTINILGRLHLLYSDYDKDIFDATGITTLDMHIIVLTIMALQSKNREVTTITIPMLLSPKVKNLNKDTVEKFFTFFAVDQAGYRNIAKTHKVYDNTFGRFNLVNRYPIVQLSSGKFIVPVIDQLFDSVAANLYFHILAHKFGKGTKISKQYLDDFGVSMERYVLYLTESSFGKKNIVPADKIVTDVSEDRCEAVAFHGDNALAIEVKKMNFKRDTVSDSDINDIDNKLVNQVGKAVEQLNITLHYVKQKNKFGILIIPDEIISPSMLLDYFDRDSKVQNIMGKNKILLCTLSSYESLMANSCDIIFEALRITYERDRHEGKDIGLILHDMQDAYDVRLIHPLSEKIFSIKAKEQEEAMQKVIT